MQAYGSGFARAYNRYWSAFAARVARPILDLYASTALSETNRRILDLGCGTGQLARCFLDRGYEVTGLDLSPHMLRYAVEHNRDFVKAGRARFLEGDARRFSLEDQVGLAVSTYDTLNHLEDLADLESCFRSVAAVLVSGGTFIFDLNTRKGLLRWNSISVEDGKDATIINRGIYDGQSDRAVVRISGFLRGADGRYDRFEETAFNTVFALQVVEELLRRTGFGRRYFARITDLTTALQDPEAEDRVFVVATRAEP